MYQCITFVHKRISGSEDVEDKHWFTELNFMILQKTKTKKGGGGMKRRQKENKQFRRQTNFYLFSPPELEPWDLDYHNPKFFPYNLFTDSLPWLQKVLEFRRYVTDKRSLMSWIPWTMDNIQGFELGEQWTNIL